MIPNSELLRVGVTKKNTSEEKKAILFVCFTKEKIRVLDLFISKFPNTERREGVKKEHELLFMAQVAL